MSCRAAKLDVITTQLLEDACGIGVYRVPCQRVGAGARCFEVSKVGSSTVRDNESFGRGRTTNISGADEQYVHGKLLVWPTTVNRLCPGVASPPVWWTPNMVAAAEESNVARFVNIFTVMPLT